MQVTPSLSVIIPTIPDRVCSFKRQVNTIKELDPTITILSDDDINKSIGRKRGELLAKVKTDYVMHIDDDDILDINIFNEINIKLLEDPDAIAFKESQYKHGHFIQIASLGCYDGTKKEMGIVHRNPVKTQLAQCVGFYDLNAREDTIFGYELTHILKQVTVINKVLYHYLDNKNIDRDEITFQECIGNPEELASIGENVFSWDKYGKIRRYMN